MPLKASNLLDMSQKELDDLFRASKAGPIPAGEANGTAIVKPGTPIADFAAHVGEGLAWQGKVFDPATQTLKNKITSAGLQQIVAKVYLAPSWFDQQECIVLDYSETSFVAQSVRDEIREIEPGFYLGIVFIGDRKTINFSLDFRPEAQRPSPLARFKNWLSGLFGRK